MSRLLINDYLAEIDRLRRYSGSSTEKVVSEAFKDLLKRCLLYTSPSPRD